MYLASVILISTAFSQQATSDTAEALQTKPNILLLVGYDTAFGDIGSFGSEVKTQNLETLAEASFRFTNLHVSPVCSVTRSTLLTEYSH